MQLVGLMKTNNFCDIIFEMKIVMYCLWKNGKIMIKKKKMRKKKVKKENLKKNRIFNLISKSMILKIRTEKKI